MSWCNRRSLLILPLALAASGLGLAACGFTPTLAPGSAAAELQNRIRLDDPQDKNGFDFLQHMEQRLGRPEQAVYDMAYVISTETVGIGVNPQGEINRYNLTGVVDWVLTRRSDQVVVASGREQSFTSYSASGTTVAALTAEQDAGVRLMEILGDQVVTYLQATAAAWAQ